MGQAEEKVTLEEEWRLLALLRSASGPITAAAAAEKLDLPGNRETKRRYVRAIVNRLREHGARIIATLAGGYWLTEEPAVWQSYLEHRQIDAKLILAEAHRRGRAEREVGQGLLFAVSNTIGIA